MAALSRPARLAGLRLPVTGADLLRPWRDGLLRCMPQRLRRWLALRNPRLVVQPHGDDAQLLLQVGDEREPIGGLDLRTGGSLVSLLAHPPKRGWRETWLELPAERVLLRHAALPAQVEDNLRQVLAFEMDRLTPFTSSDVYFDARVVGRVARGSKLDVELAVARRDAAADWLDRLREGRSPASRLVWPGAWPGANLLPREERAKRPRFGSLLTQALLALVITLLVAALVTPLWQKRRALELLDAELRRVRGAATAVEDVREALERARLGSVEVLNRKRDHPRMIDLLRELTDILPDGTWVQTLNFRDGEVDIRGESDQATALIGMLENGPGISAVSFRSPVMQVASTGQERFHISFAYARPEAE
ncbi:MAG: PilN domain-containing protein [Thiohalocapsa sp.]|uniref:PilN domain-containing protein n=1 Tax=Thiohalocapsa sp. TaxID=2497641 RepID=UPI0025DEDE33|nr:PilN domain-containing protein [Thiohalocapsa sp.]MCG6941197.1 PilN domain-containing protein [Thiohalocapsa sp.]